MAQSSGVKILRKGRPDGVVGLEGTGVVGEFPDSDRIYPQIMSQWAKKSAGTPEILRALPH